MQRPLVDIAPVYPEPPQPDPEVIGTDLTPTTVGSGTAVGLSAPAGPVRQRPIGLRLEQTLANGSTPSRTVLGLRRQYNCFWISL